MNRRLTPEDMDADGFGVLPIAPRQPEPLPLEPLPAEVKHGALYVVCLFGAIVALYVVAGWTPPDFWSLK